MESGKSRTTILLILSLRRGDLRFDYFSAFIRISPGHDYISPITHARLEYPIIHRHHARFEHHGYILTLKYALDDISRDFIGRSEYDYKIFALTMLFSIHDLTLLVADGYFLAVP